MLIYTEKNRRPKGKKKKFNKKNLRDNGKLALKRTNQLRARATPAEKKLLHALTQEGIDFKFQKAFYNAYVVYVVDFYFENVFGKKYVIEIDCVSRKKNGAYDKKRSLFLYHRRGCCVKRFTNEQVLSDVESVVEEICSLSPKEYKPIVKIIPEGLKGDGTFQEEEYGYVMGRTSNKFKKYRGSSLNKRM